jgi:ribulose bisphosphate carboxylase small subunit
MHLFEVWRILKLWRMPDVICRCGLLHSAYSNSYVNLAIFDPTVGRETVQVHFLPFLSP